MLGYPGKITLFVARVDLRYTLKGIALRAHGYAYANDLRFTALNMKIDYVVPVSKSILPMRNLCCRSDRSSRRPL